MFCYHRSLYRFLAFMLVLGFAGGMALAQANYDIYFPQMADGNGYQTTFVITNSNNIEAIGTLSLFQSNGLPLFVTINGVTASTFNITVPARGTVRMQTDGAPLQPISIRTGWVRVRANVILGGSALYQLIQDGRVLAEAGVLAAPLTRGFTIFADSTSFADTGIAIANPNNFSTPVQLRLMDKFGIEKANITLNFGPGEHMARFITQLFSGTPGIVGFEGSVVGFSPSEVVAVTLRYDNRNLDVFTTLPISADSVSQPVITEVIPNAGSQGATVTITGRNFSMVPDNNVVRFGSVVATVSAVTPAGVVTTVPARAITGPVTVSVGTLTSNGYNFFVDPPAFGALEVPMEGAITSGSIRVSGYALDTVGVTRVNILVDGRNLGDATLGISRPDVGAAFPNYPNSGNAGFLFTFNSYDVGNGVHNLVARVTNTKGTTEDIGSRNIIVDVTRDPVLLSINPNNLRAGSATFVLTVTGRNFFSYSKIYFGNTLISTTFVDSQTLTGVIPAGLIAAPGSIPVVVKTMVAFGELTSSPLTFTVQP
jgi:hypothetical protein